MTKSYIYSNRSQILCQRDGGQSADEYFYVTDRLGSVRQLVDNTGNLVLNYTYSPFGATLESSIKDGYESSFNSFMFTGQWWDDEFDQYYLRARMYDPALGRFTTRDPVRGRFNQPLSLHRYLYCQNDPINRIDPSGEFALLAGLSGSFNFNLRSIAKDIFTEMPIWKGIASRILKPALSGLMAYHLVELPLMTMTGSLGLGASGGAGLAAAKDTRRNEGFWKGWSIGGVGWLSGGVGLSTGKGVSGTIDIGISFKAQLVEHLRGPYWEVGGSVTAPWPFPCYTGGFTYSQSLYKQEELGEYVDLWTLSPIGIGSSTGAEVHGYLGYMGVDEWWRN
ncbi:MAG: RHS repeat domain-containing protein [Planctomycetota bacterium]